MSAVERVCAQGTVAKGTGGRGYCGRTSAKRRSNWLTVTCADCKAARAADLGAKS